MGWGVSDFGWQIGLPSLFSYQIVRSFDFGRNLGMVQTPANIPATARPAGAVIIHINKDPVNLAAESDISLIGDATALLPTLVALAAGEEIQRLRAGFPTIFR